MNINNIPFINSTQGPLIVSNGLLLYYSFNQKLETTIYDLSGNQNHGTIVGTPYWTDTVTKRDVAYQIVSGSSYIQCNNFVDITTGTISFWFKFNNSVDNDYICGNGNWSNDRNGVNIAQNLGRFYFELCDATGRQSTNPSYNIVTSEWHMATFTWDGTNIRIYIDGNQYSSLGQTRVPICNVYRFRVARNPEGSAYQMDNGNLDEIRVYNRSLNRDEILNLYLSTSG